MHITHNHFNLVSAEEGEIVPAKTNDEDENERVTTVEIEKEFSDYKTYIDKEIEAIELIYDKSKDKGSKTDSNLTPNVQSQETRIGRRVKPPEQYRDTIHINFGGMHFTVREIHFTVGGWI